MMEQKHLYSFFHSSYWVYILLQLSQVRWFMVYIWSEIKTKRSQLLSNQFITCENSGRLWDKKNLYV